MTVIIQVRLASAQKAVVKVRIDFGESRVEKHAGWVQEAKVVALFHAIQAIGIGVLRHPNANVKLAGSRDGCG